MLGRHLCYHYTMTACKPAFYTVPAGAVCGQPCYFWSLNTRIKRQYLPTQGFPNALTSEPLIGTLAYKEANTIGGISVPPILLEHSFVRTLILLYFSQKIIIRDNWICQPNNQSNTQKSRPIGLAFPFWAGVLRARILK